VALLLETPLLQISSGGPDWGCENEQVDVMGPTIF